MKPRYFSAVLLVVLGSMATAQTQIASSSPDVPQEQIIALSQAGISDSVILALLHKNNHAYDLTPQQIIELKKDNVSEAVIQTMLDPGSALPQPRVSETVTTTISPYSNPSGATIPVGEAATGDPNNPLLPHDSGIYLFSQGQMTMLDRTSNQAQKVTGIFATAITFGIAPARIKSEMPGAHAEIQTEDQLPVFYFYFDDKPAGLGKAQVISLSNPNQFVLLKMQVGKQSREVSAGAAGILRVSMGTDPKAQVPFRSERIKPGLYQVTLDHPLPVGEYCFLASTTDAGSAMPSDIYDFGIRAAKE